MDSKFYVSLEAARLLKEKGYRQAYHAYYFGNSNLRKGGYGGDSWYDSPDFYPAPTKAEAIDWLESKGIIIELSVTHDLCHWVFSIYMKGGEEILTNTDFDCEYFPTRLAAKDAAIIKTLELL